MDQVPHGGGDLGRGVFALVAMPMIPPRRSMQGECEAIAGLVIADLDGDGSPPFARDRRPAGWLGPWFDCQTFSRPRCNGVLAMLLSPVHLCCEPSWLVWPNTLFWTLALGITGFSVASSCGCSGRLKVST